MQTSSPLSPNGSSSQTDPVIEVRDRRRQNFFTIDNVLLDYHGAEMKAHGIAVYVALARFANQDSECWPSLNTIAQRTGMSRQQVIREIDKLKRLKLVEVTKQLGPKGEHRSNLYTLLDIQGVVTHSDQGSNTQLLGVVTHSYQGSNTQLLGVVTHSDQGSNTQLPKQNIINKIQENKTNRTTSDGSHEREGDLEHDGKQDPKQDVVVVLTQRGISENVAKRLADRYKWERVEEKIEFLGFTLETEPEKAKNPAGWLRRAIEENWAAPEGFISKAERERLAQLEVRRAEEEAESAVRREEEFQRKEKEEERERAAFQQRLSDRYGTAETERELWRTVMMKGEGQVPSSLYALLQSCHLLTLQNNVALIGTETEYQYNQLQHPGTSVVLKRIFRAMIGEEPAIEYVVLDTT